MNATIFSLLQNCQAAVSTFSSFAGGCWSRGRQSRVVLFLTVPDVARQNVVGPGEARAGEAGRGLAAVVGWPAAL